ncbi:hypothetical protein KRM28CT15_35840 [Krasilnikovia sp. M28-CT-15]
MAGCLAEFAQRDEALAQAHVSEARDVADAEPFHHRERERFPQHDAGTSA